LTYEYDYGSTTRLRLKVVAHREAPSRREIVRLLARNDNPVWPCSECQETASVLCAYCFSARVTHSSVTHMPTNIAVMVRKQSCRS